MKKVICLLVTLYTIILTLTVVMLSSACTNNVGINYPSVEELLPKVGIDKIVTSYIKDRVAADLIYKNKVISSSGVVNFVGWEPKLNRRFVYIVPKVSEKRLAHTLRCILLKNHVKVRIGQKVIAQGTVVGYWSHLEFIRCRLTFVSR